MSHFPLYGSTFLVWQPSVYGRYVVLNSQLYKDASNGCEQLARAQATTTTRVGLAPLSRP